MEVFHISSLLVGNQFHDVVVDISFFDIIFFFFFLVDIFRFHPSILVMENFPSIEPIELCSLSNSS